MRNSNRLVVATRLVRALGIWAVDVAVVEVLLVDAHLIRALEGVWLETV